MFKRKVRFLKREREKYEERSEREKKSYFFSLSWSQYQTREKISIVGFKIMKNILQLRGDFTVTQDCMQQIISHPDSITEFLFCPFL